MMWLAWRQFRGNALLAATTAAAAIAILLLTQQHIVETAGTDALSTVYESLRLLGTGLIGLPAFIGAFWGAPLLARDLEAGTHRLAWTQSITRQRWLTSKLATAGAIAIALTAAFSLVFTWWSLPFDELNNRVGTANFGQRGIAPVAYAVFALALGTLVGAVMKKTLPAMAVTLLGFFVVRFTFQLVARPHLMHAVTASLPNNSFGQRQEQFGSMGAWILSSHTVDAAGHVLTDRQIDNLLVEACGLTRDSPPEAWADCAHRVGLHDVVTMHPASHFWPLQMWESAAFLILAAGLAAATTWWVRHRTA